MQEISEPSGKYSGNIRKIWKYAVNIRKYARNIRKHAGNIRKCAGSGLFH
jgi:hypothetical protein